MTTPDGPPSLQAFSCADARHPPRPSDAFARTPSATRSAVDSCTPNAGFWQ